MADIGIPNGDFSATATVPPLPWSTVEATGSAGVLFADVYHTASPSFGVAGTNDIWYYQCVPTSDWEGRVAVWGWVLTNYTDYQPENGWITVTWHADEVCGGDGVALSLSAQAFAGSYWTQRYGEVDLGTSPRAAHNSMKVSFWGQGNEEVYFDDFGAQQVEPTGVTTREVAARSGGLAGAAALVAGTGALAVWRRRGRAQNH